MFVQGTAQRPSTILDVMKDQFKRILDGLPAMSPQSCLEPYRELIHELRRRNYSYREISRVLLEKCDLRVYHSTVHDFVQRQLLVGHEREPRESVDLRESNKKPSGSVRTRATRPEKSAKGVPRTEELHQRIAAMKRSPPIVNDDAAGFKFDPTEPLQLKPAKP